MSKTILETGDVPKYIREIASRLYLATDYAENDVPGYTFKLYGKYKLGYEGQLVRDCEKILAWCKRHYADAYIVSEHFYYTRVEFPSWIGIGSKQHRAKAYREGFQNYYKLVITDPVAHRFEKDGYYREK